MVFLVSIVSSKMKISNCIADTHTPFKPIDKNQCIGRKNRTKKEKQWERTKSVCVCWRPRENKTTTFPFETFQFEAQERKEMPKKLNDYKSLISFRYALCENIHFGLFGWKLNDRSCGTQTHSMNMTHKMCE